MVRDSRFKVISLILIALFSLFFVSAADIIFKDGGFTAFGISFFESDVTFNAEVNGVPNLEFEAGRSSSVDVVGETSIWLRGINGVAMSSTKGPLAPCDGSITYLTTQYDASLLTFSPNLCTEVMVNNVLVFNVCDSGSGVRAKTRTQARNIDTFSKGDVINVRMRNIGSNISHITVDDSFVKYGGYCDD